uniref:G-protein coupled receptors family 1 profile domain-containing protein n=1 Tax=Biomphalaria glabrata TaxID=6526 RepID=A0A2C9L920_BIOGL
MGYSNANVSFINSSKIWVSDGAFNKLIDDETLRIIILVQYCTISTIINICGIASNIVNIIVFFKQGFKEAMNISLVGLALSDLFSLFFLQWENICFSPMLQEADVPFFSLEVQYLSGGWPRMCCLRITAWITAYITFEKCLCIAVPLKVRLILTPKRTFIIIICIYLIIMAAVSPIYYTTRLVYKFFPSRNRTQLGIGFTEDRVSIDGVLFITNNVFLPVTAFVTVAVCTFILTFKLNRKAKWREVSTTKTEHMSIKEKQLMKMVILISAFFIGCFSPNAIVFFWMAKEPEFNIAGKYENIFIAVFDYCFLLESLNAALNTVIYYKMSSKYRQIFRGMFCGQHKKPAGQSDQERQNVK